MSGTSPRHVTWMILGASFLLVSAGRLVQFGLERNDIWWTPAAMAVPLGDSHERVRVAVGGTPLEELVSSGRLQLLTDSHVAPVSADQIDFRFNNYDRVRAVRIPVLVGEAAMAGAAFVILLAGLVGLVRGTPSVT